MGVVEIYRGKRPRYGFRAEKVAQLPRKAPCRKRSDESEEQDNPNGG